MAETYLFKWRHYESEIILLCVRWYLRYFALLRPDHFEMTRGAEMKITPTPIITVPSREALGYDDLAGYRPC